MSLEDKFDSILARYESLSQKLSSPEKLDNREFSALSKECSDLRELTDGIHEYRAVETQINDTKEMLEDPDLDQEMRSLAEVELEDLIVKLPKLREKLQIMLLPKDEADEKNAILEIRAGTGGDEAGLFAGDLLRMYQRYAELQGWKFEVMSASNSELGGVKDVTALISGTNVFSRLKFEAGVHRVQRVPKTETAGRIHTSAATVAVLPEAEDIDVHIEEKDIRIDVFRSSGPGGQSVNTTDSAVRITHLPTGIVVQQQDEKSQHKNKAKALKILKSRIYENERQQREAERSASRRSQVGSGDRSERIRTYNFPQSRITDHRVNLTLYKLEKILMGEGLDEIIDALVIEDQAAKLAESVE